mgnify:FL=1|tara:strand:+ start:8761 stop:8937 length:177 start_codon:yes stop_codon:yes gene_type:complete
MASEKTEMYVKGKILTILKPLFEKNPSLMWVLNDQEIESVLYNYVNKIYDEISDELSE